ncbi:hypothetical protein [Hyphomicrobium sp.]|uniref:hypothetical protein n=1 Tax=Hyphomicrobium sp. TaxID=82 RepID=UPI0025C267E9|nr:hypothetical protein [Hyphomicrobium sp.]MCC7252545.1 hypothetical protein [Hyphomicrobium sp.]
MMFRRTIAAVALAAMPASAHAEAWMVKSSTLGCRDRETLVKLDAAGASQSLDALPAGCVVLDAGERLLDQPVMGGGFSDYVELERRDGSMLFVRSSAMVPDPGIGSVYDER